MIRDDLGTWCILTCHVSIQEISRFNFSQYCLPEGNVTSEKKPNAKTVFVASHGDWKWHFPQGYFLLFWRFIFKIHFEVLPFVGLARGSMAHREYHHTIFGPHWTFLIHIWTINKLFNISLYISKEEKQHKEIWGICIFWHFTHLVFQFHSFS